MKLSLNPYVKHLEESATEVVDNEIKRMRREGINDIVSLGVGEPYFDTPLVIKEAAKQALDMGITKYQPTLGDYELRKAISQKFLLDNEIKAGVEDIIVTPGAKFAIYLAFQSLIEVGDKVMVLDPSWVSHTSIPLMLGATLVRIPTIESEGFQPDINAIELAMKGDIKCMIINSPCNPTGAVYPKSTIRQIVEIANKEGVLVLSDEIYEDIIYEGEHYSPASEFDNVITVNGFSKSFAMTGWRLGYVTGPKQLLDEMIKVYQHSASCVTSFSQAGALEALVNKKCKEATKSMVLQFRHNRKVMMDFLDQSEHFTCSTPDGAFYCFVRYSLPKKSLDLAKELLEKIHVATVPGKAFGDCGENHLRLSYATSEKNLIEGLDRISNYFNQQN